MSTPARSTVSFLPWPDVSREWRYRVRFTLKEPQTLIVSVVSDTTASNVPTIGSPMPPKLVTVTVPLVQSYVCTVPTGSFN